MQSFTFYNSGQLRTFTYIVLYKICQLNGKRRDYNKALNVVCLTEKRMG